MKKLYFIICFTLLVAASYCQDVIGSRVIAKNSLFVRDRWVDTVTVDTSKFLNYNRSIPTAGAVYEFVNARMGGGGGGLFGSIGEDFVISGDSLKNAGFVNVEDFGAVGDGVTNNTTAFQNAVNTGKPVYVPPGTFLLSTSVSLLPNQRIFGHDWTSIIKITANVRGALIVDTGSVVSNLKFIGNGKAGTGAINSGIWITNAVGGSIDHCMFTGFSGDNILNGGGGIFGSTIGTGNSDGWRITDNYFYDNDCGLNLATRAEYVTVFGNTFGSNNTAILGTAGNLSITGNIIHNNTTGFKSITTTNGAHSTITSNIINHNTYPIWIENATHGLGFTFNDNMIYFGAIKIINSNNVKFANCHFGQLDSIFLDNAKYITRIGGWFGLTESSGTIPIRKYNGAEDFAILGETTYAADSINNWIKQIHNDTITFKGPMYHTGITPASSSVGDSVWVKDASTNQWKLRAQSDITGGLTNPMTTAGDIIVGGASGTPTRLGIGAALNILRVNAGATALEWAAASGGGDVSKVGTPVNDQVGVWTGDGTIEGTSGLTYNGTNLSVGGVVVPTISSTNTLTNKRWTPRVGSTTSSATPTINTDDVDIYKLTAQTVDITSFTTNLSGTPADGDILEIQITGTGAIGITWGSSFVSSTVTLPTTTVTTATLSVVFQYFTTSSYGNNKWVCVNSF